MAVHSLGKVTVSSPGSPVQATVNQASPNTRIPCYALMFQALPTNSGKVYVGLASMNKSTLAQCLAVLPIPGTTSAAAYSIAAPNVPGAFNMADFFIDADSAQDGVLVTYVAG